MATMIAVLLKQLSIIPARSNITARKVGHTTTDKVVNFRFRICGCVILFAFVDQPTA
jgi:hypothetical protein